MRVYYQYFHVVMYLMPVGLGVGIYDVAQRFGSKVDSRTAPM